MTYVCVCVCVCVEENGYSCISAFAWTDYAKALETSISKANRWAEVRTQSRSADTPLQRSSLL